MNRKCNILSGALLLLVSGGCFQSCQEDELVIKIPDKETLIAEGKYLTARSDDSFKVVDPTDRPKPFPVGTPYRLLAFSKAYDENNSDDETPATHLRFNKVAWEGKYPENDAAEGMRYINVDSDPDKWFGFSALEGEDAGGTNGLVSLDYYGFTYGVKADTVNYIELNMDADGNLSALGEITRSDSVVDGNLADLMRGVLLNQNIKTAGKTKANDGTLSDNRYAQSIMQYKHCFSKLHFQVSQQGDESNLDENGDPTPCFENLYVDRIDVTGTYGEGSVYLQSGKVKIAGDTCSRTLKFDPAFEDNSRKVGLTNSEVGEMILFPSDGSSLVDMPDGYDIGLKITVKSTVKHDIENMLANTGGPDIPRYDIREVVDAAGVTWYYGTIVKPFVLDYYVENKHLQLRQDAAYMLIIIFQKDAVRIITVIPMVEEWLPGEGTPDVPWEEQYLGQPQMFDNVVWSDRNLGADHYDPRTDVYELTVGYFYQAGRNIPYYPFDPAIADPINGPDFSRINKQELSNQDTEWTSSHGVDTDNEGKKHGSRFKFFPIVDKEILNMNRNKDGTLANWTYVAPKYNPAYSDNLPQLYIPEKKPEKEYYNFYDGIWNAEVMNWQRGPQYQPVAGVWEIPSVKQFMTIFPSTPHAGNITMKTGGDNNNPMTWGDDWDNKTTSKTLRVTIPFYKPGMAKPTDRSKYAEAWQILDDHKDPGTTHLTDYTSGSPESYTWLEPDGDPDDGFASAYVISREEGSKYSLSGYVKDETEFSVREWGTIYAIKRIYTPQAYRMRWRALIAKKDTRNPCIYLEICRYRCTENDTLTETCYKNYDWDHPAATLYFPICGLGDYTGQYINFGTECQYAASDSIEGDKASAVQIKITGNRAMNSYIAVIKSCFNRNFGMQIRPVVQGGVVNSSK